MVLCTCLLPFHTYRFIGSMASAMSVDAVVMATERARSVLNIEHQKFE